MTKRYKTLQKKLQELEAELNLVFSLPAETTTPYHHVLSEGIEQRFVFLKNLLSAEIASHPSSKPRHLRHIGQRLTELEIAFREWDDYRAAAVDNFDGASVCSCDDYDSCRNDDDREDSNLPPYGDQFEEKFPVADVKSYQGTEKLGINEVVLEKDKGTGSVLGRYWPGVLATAGIVLGTLLIGAGAVIEIYGSSYNSSLREGFLIPT
ncbi:hypothetical protein M9H77_10603 [Catharanthus roseus]|uniref:Uncharacterized protein n=1 Tax=Catharanthus roseus TaxID=4058 RepID=A0ACC0BC90_CATRO|nr:hypothetical protein M9H77_10603 [Catharanthus roseus]